MIKIQNSYQCDPLHLKGPDVVQSESWMVNNYDSYDGVLSLCICVDRSDVHCGSEMDDSNRHYIIQQETAAS